MKVAAPSISAPSKKSDLENPKTFIKMNVAILYAYLNKNLAKIGST